MKQRVLLLLSGAVGIFLTALFYFIALQIQGALSILVLIPSASSVIFVLILLVALVEIGVMTFALGQLARQLRPVYLYWIAAGYVSFAGVYALGYALFVADVQGIQILCGLAFLRWLTLLFVQLASPGG